MSLALHCHPLASFCWKVLIALYENDTPFTSHVVDLMNERERAEFLKISPFGKFPVIHDDERGQTVLESTIIIDYLAQRFPGTTALLPKDPDRALCVRYWDRFFDFYVHEPMQKVVADRRREPDQRDPYGVQQAKAQLEASYAFLEKEMTGKTWAIGEEFTMADCSALPALHYGNRVHPFGAHAVTAAYLERLLARPSVSRVIREATPYFHLFPEETPATDT
jgi:glutathione S-transferase